jgi:hypothetical protein
VHRIGTVEIDGEGGRPVDGDREGEAAPGRVEPEHAGDPSPRGQPPCKAPCLDLGFSRVDGVPGVHAEPAHHDGCDLSQRSGADVRPRLPQRLVAQGGEPRGQVAERVDLREARDGFHCGSGARATILPGPLDRAAIGSSRQGTIRSVSGHGPTRTVCPTEGTPLSFTMKIR